MHVVLYIHVYQYDACSLFVASLARAPYGSTNAESRKFSVPRTMSYRPEGASSPSIVKEVERGGGPHHRSLQREGQRRCCGARGRPRGPGGHGPHNSANSEFRIKIDFGLNLCFYCFYFILIRFAHLRWICNGCNIYNAYAKCRLHRIFDLLGEISL